MATKTTKKTDKKTSPKAAEVSPLPSYKGMFSPSLFTFCAVHFFFYPFVSLSTNT